MRLVRWYLDEERPGGALILDVNNHQQDKFKKIAAGEAALTAECLRRDTFGAFRSSSMPSKTRAHAKKHTTEQENISVGGLCNDILKF